MKVIIENDISLADFDAWSGGADTLDTLIEKDLCEQLESIIDDEAVSGEGGWSDTSLNDFLWFERDTIAEWLGFNDWEELENGKDDEDDYDEEQGEKELNEAIETGVSFKCFCLDHDCDHCPLKDEVNCEEWYNNMVSEDEAEE